MITIGYCQSIKFPTDQEIGCVHNDLVTQKVCHDILEKPSIRAGESMTDMLDMREDLHTQKRKPVEDMIKVMLEEAFDKHI